MQEINQDLPPQIRPPEPTTLQARVEKEYRDFIIQAKKNPQLMQMIENTKLFWSEFGFRIKLLTASIGIVIIIIFGLRFGSTLASVFKPAPALPSAIPDVTPTPAVQISTDLQKIQEDIKSFSVLLPDPATPPVDPDIYLKTPPPKK